VKEIIKKFHNSGLKDDIKLSYRYDDLDWEKIASWTDLQIRDQKYPTPIKNLNTQTYECKKIPEENTLKDVLKWVWYFLSKPLRTNSSYNDKEKNERKIELDSYFTRNEQTYLQSGLVNKRITQNSNWTYNVYLVVYFIPQWLLYLLLCIWLPMLIILILYFICKRKNKK
jgi:hypothetical protein